MREKCCTLTSAQSGPATDYDVIPRYNGEPVMQIILVAAFLVAIATITCGPSATTPVPDSGTGPQSTEKSGPALLLDEESAISILQTFLQDCVLSWDTTHAGRIRFFRSDAMRAFHYGEEMDRIRTREPRTPRPTFTPLPPEAYQLPSSAREKQSWLIDLATGTTGDFVWSANYHGVTEVPISTNPVRGSNTKAETWVVIGPGLDRSGSQSATPGRWQVYAGHQRAYYLDAPARLALEEYDSYNSCP